MKKIGFLFLYLITGLLVIILLLSLVFSVNPLDFFKYTSENPEISIVYIILLYFLILTSVLYLSKKFFPAGLNNLGFSAKYLKPLPMSALIFYIIISFAVYTTVLVKTGIGSLKVNFSQLFFIAIQGLVFGFLFAFIEELLFRGFILQILIKEKNLFWGFTLSSLIFSLLHLFRPGNFTFKIIYFIGLFILGLVLSYSFTYTKSLWTPIIIHTTLVACMYFFSNGISIDMTDYNKLSFLWGLDSTPIAGLFGVVFVLSIIFPLKIFLTKNIKASEDVHT